MHNKREYSRNSVSFNVGIELANGQRAKGTAINIGRGGMLLDKISGTILSKLDDVNLYLPINHSQNSYSIAAKVTRVDGTQIGLFFYSDPSEYLQEAFE
ncbi:PilZ domain-containing protein [sulfur-oxidizing endosymbiont of Gigantopelta aegis]|uniref:PilZ domain-containing protein n=1 Tax=sulfur-oxidizing endosymbiont of Gigantopelta aegis TaxID=2794934 RepID=UPI0018DC6129|nr:PilZ domain-containing protein [sulfur-oxidizing endosymbiont of Gigantopelta aegis]